MKRVCKIEDELMAADIIANNGSDDIEICKSLKEEKQLILVR